MIATLEYMDTWKDLLKSSYLLKPGDMCTINLEVYIQEVHHALNKMFLPIPSQLYGMRMATAQERLDGIGPV